MTSTAGTPGPYDPLDKAKPDEPVFTLIGRDKHAPPVVLHWVDLFRAEALEIDDDEERKAALIKATDAEMIAADMIRWRRGHPETDTTTKRSSYTGGVQSTAEFNEAQRRAALLQMLAYLRESAFYLSEGAAELTKLDLLTDLQLVELDKALSTINTVADAHTPVRHGSQPELPMEQPEVETGFDMNAFDDCYSEGGDANAPD